LCNDTVRLQTIVPETGGSGLITKELTAMLIQTLSRAEGSLERLEVKKQALGFG
jgi:hypothetical protein